MQYSRQQALWAVLIAHFTGVLLSSSYRRLFSRFYAPWMCWWYPLCCSDSGSLSFNVFLSTDRECSDPPTTEPETTNSDAAEQEVTEDGEGQAEQWQPVGDVPLNAPSECPGLESSKAGKAEACAGCPNQRICSSGEANRPNPAVAEVKQKLKDVKHKVLVLSGKGGVGKSTVSTQLAWVLQARGYEVGLLDIDICGPSIPKMTGVTGQDIHMSGEGWSPVYVEENLAVMSIGFLLPELDDAVIWRGPKKDGLIRQFLTDVCWGPLDFLVLDTPPGTSDEHLSIVTYLRDAGIDGAVVVTTPQEISLQDVRKEINFCKKTGIRVLGVVENMSQSVFAESAGGGARKMAEKMEVPYACAIPLETQLLQACEEGRSVQSTSCDSARSLQELADKLIAAL